MTAIKGSNMFNWNMRYPDAEGFDGLIMWAAGLTGPKAVPGSYKVKLIVDGYEVEQDFEILKDPRSESSLADIQNQFEFLMSIRDKVSETHTTIKDIRTIKSQIKALSKNMGDDEEYKSLIKEGKRISDELSEIEKKLYQVKNKSGQDPLNYPIRLNNKLAHLSSLNGRGDYPPTDQSIAVKDELASQIDEQVSNYRKIVENDVPAFNRSVSDKGVDAIKTKIAEPIN